MKGAQTRDIGRIMDSKPHITPLLLQTVYFCTKSWKHAYKDKGIRYLHLYLWEKGKGKFRNYLHNRP